MDQLQNELDGEGYSSKISILGVNGVGLESGNASVTSGRDLPWLQDTAAANVWASWGVVYRDVWILDGENRLVGVYNLTQHDLNDAANFAALKAMLTSAAGD